MADAKSLSEKPLPTARHEASAANTESVGDVPVGTPSPDSAFSHEPRAFRFDKASRTGSKDRAQAALKNLSVQVGQRYREEILNLKDAGQVEKTTGLTIAQYDAHVITPFLRLRMGMWTNFYRLAAGIIL